MNVQPRPRAERRPSLSIDRLEQFIALVGGLLIVAGVALIYAPAALVVAGSFLLLSVIDLRRPRP